MNFVFLMDPLHTVKPEKDTSLMLMIEAASRGNKVFFLPEGGLTRKEGKTFFHVVEVVPVADAEEPFIEKGSKTLSEDDIQALFIRTDPPFDEDYLLNTWLLDLLPEHIFVMNKPSGIRTCNEKIWATQFVGLIPKTIIARNKKDLLEFLGKERNVIAKPTDSFGGQSVFHVHAGDRNANVILETLTQNWQREIILQEYVAAAQDGDKRILLLNGEPLGAVLRQHSEDDHRNNFFAGGKPLTVKITERDKEIISRLKDQLRRLGLYFVGIDIIGDYLIEVNNTSPTCLQEMNRLYDCHLEKKIIDFVERQIKERN